MQPTSKPSKAIMTKLLMQAANGLEDVPGLYAALQSGATVPTTLPLRQLSQAEFLANYMVPWLAERLCNRVRLSTVVRAYETASRGDYFDVSSLDNRIVRAIYALRYSVLRDILRYDDDALSVVISVGRIIRAPTIISTWLYPDRPLALSALATDLWIIAVNLIMPRPELSAAMARPSWSTVYASDWPADLVPVMRHLDEIAQALKESLDPNDELAK